MKVSEAEKLVCPFIQLAHIQPMNITESGTSTGHCNCITTECMAWKMDKEFEYDALEANRYASQSHDSFDNRTSIEKFNYFVKTKGKKLAKKDCEGYCQRLQQ